MTASDAGPGAAGDRPATRTRRTPLVLALATSVAAVGCGPAADAPTIEMTIPPGSTFSAVIDSLGAHGLVANRTLFRLVARVRGIDRSTQAGLYRFRAGESMWGVLRALRKAEAVTTRFTIPEGSTIGDVASLAETRLGIPADSVRAAARDPMLADSLIPGSRTLEGFLYPETYLVPAGITGRELVTLLAASSNREWDPAWDRRLDTLRLSRAELLALASIVEGEARRDDERGTIAGVYWNRLRDGMALQADPTVQYAIELKTGDRKPRLYEKDYQIQSTYNTYLHPGLPPGPVNSPGRRSIEAALFPADVPYRFFVALPDGRHIFARTYDEHLRNVARARREAARARAESAAGHGSP